MAKDHITISHKTLKDLEVEMDYHIAAFQQTWQAIKVTFDNFKREMGVKEE